MGSEIDFMSCWLTFFLGFLGITDVEIVAADGIMGADGEAKIAAAQDAALKLAALCLEAPPRPVSPHRRGGIEHHRGLRGPRVVFGAAWELHGEQ